MTLGEKIYRLRTEQGMSQENFGDMLGVSRQSVSKWETDQSVPELDKVVAISEMLGVSTDYLLKESVEGYQEQRMAQGRQQGSFHYEYKSKKTFMGMPLVHVNIGLRLCAGKRCDRYRQCRTRHDCHWDCWIRNHYLGTGGCRTSVCAWGMCCGRHCIWLSRSRCDCRRSNQRGHFHYGRAGGRTV